MHLNTRKVGAAFSAVALLLVAACGGDDDDNGEASGSASGDVEVFTWWAEGGEKAGLDGLVSVFDTECSDFSFVNGAVAGGAGSNAKSVLASRLQTNDPPDTFQAHAGGELSDYIAAGQVQDLSADFEEWGLTDAFPQGLIDNITVDGKIYSIPANIHRANVVWANPTVLQGAGLATTAPADIDTWIADLEKLKAGGVEAPLAIAKDWTQTMLLETVLISELGPDGFNGLWTGDTAWDSAEASGAVDKFATLLGFANTDRDSLDWPDAANYVTEGQAAYTVMGDWTAANFDQEQLVPDTDYVYWPVPGNDGVFQWLADSFVLPTGAPNEAGTKCWLQTVGSAEGQKEFNTKKGSIPARTDASAADYGQYQQSAMEDFGTDELVVSLAHGSAASIAWINDVNSATGAFSGSQDVDALKSALVTAAENHAQ